MHPENLSIADFKYDLPQECIAIYPLAERDSSKLLIYKDGEIREDSYRHIASYIPENSLLVFNNTKVVEARIIFQKSTGARIEIFCLEPPPGYHGIADAMMQQGRVRWKCLIGGASKWKPGQVLTRSLPMSVSTAAENSVQPSPAETSGLSAQTQVGAGQQDLTLEARYLEKLEDAFLIEFAWTPGHLSFAEMLHKAGLIPLPPYIKRTVEAADSERYQTIYARHDGSVAAPTAGLHFTPTIFDSLAAKKIDTAFVTLHVGAGTFMPVKSPTMGQHIMHTEYIAVSRDSINTLIKALPQTIIPVGTTSLRTIESLYWLGLRTMEEPDIAPEDLTVEQWSPYSKRPGSEVMPPPPPTVIDTSTALKALLNWMDRKGTDQLIARTQLLITPGYEWKVAGGLITNFHQPESTLLLLVAALIGEDWKKVYQYAKDHQFRFLSYGDGSLLFPPSSNKKPA